MSDFKLKDEDIINAAKIPTPEGHIQRGSDNVITNIPPINITLENINGILLNHLQNIIIPTIKVNDIDTPVPIEGGLPERWEAVKKYGFLREPQSEKLLTPLIMIRRTNVKQGQLKNPVNKYVYQTITKEWNPRNAYDKFAVLNGITPSKQIRNVIIPDYMDLTYTILMWTEQQSQMDQLIEQINVENYEFWGDKNTYKFHININEFKGTSELPATEDRVVRTEFEMIVQAYILPERMVKNFKLASTNIDNYTYKKIVVNESIMSQDEIKKMLKGR